MLQERSVKEAFEEIVQIEPSSKIDILASKPNLFDPFDLGEITFKTQPGL